MNMVERHQKDILRYFEKGLTNAKAEKFKRPYSKIYYLFSFTRLLMKNYSTLEYNIMKHDSYKFKP